MASVFNTSVPDALEAIQAGLRGESDPLERYGVSLTAAKVQAEALAETHKKVATQLTSAELATARMNLIMKQTSATQGDFQRTSGGLANQQRILSAEWTNLKAKLGTAVLPILAKLAQMLTLYVVPGISTVVRYVQTKWPAVRTVIVTEWNRVYPYLVRLGTFIATTVRKYWPEVSSTVRQVLTTVRAVISAAISIIELIWKRFGSNIVAQVRNQFQFVITLIRAQMRVLRGIIDVVLGLIHGDWSRVWKGLREIFSGEMLAIRGALRYAMATLRNVISLGLKLIVTLFGGLASRIGSAVGNLGSLLYHKGTALVGGLITGTEAKWGQAAAWLGGLGSRALHAIPALGSVLWNAGTNLIGGFIGGIKSKFGEVESTLGGLTHKLTSWKGPPEVDAKILTGSGQLVMDGFTKGLMDRFGTVRSTLRGFTDSLAPGAVSPGALAMPGGPGVPGLAGAGGGGQLVLRVETGGDPMDLLLAQLIRRYVRVNGGNVQTVFGR
jgi:hypothetical protein